MSAISITKLYDSLVIKLGKETAENLTTFIENKIDKELENKTTIFATKEDIAKGFGDVKNDFAKLDTKINEFEKRIIEKINGSEIATIKWMVGLVLALAGLIILYLKLIVSD